MRRTRGGQSGYAYVLVLIIAIVATMLAMTLITNTTAGIAGETKRYATDRARMNSESGLTLTEIKLKKDVPKLLKQIVTEANADDRFGGQMALSTLTFEPMDYTWGPLPGEGNTAEDTAEVHVEITLPGPPVVTNTSGLPSGPEVGTVETYCFVAHLTAAGHSMAGTTWRAEKLSNLYVTLVLGEVEASVLSGLGSGNIIDLGKVEGPMFEQPEGRDGRAWWDPTPVAYAAGPEISIGAGTLKPVGNFTLSDGAPPSGGWSGEPQIVSGPTEVGLPNGGSVFYWYVRGLPTGTAFTVAPDDTYGATGYVLATDGWRYDPSYRASDDTVPIQQPDGTIIRKKGTPNYGVVAIKSPEGVDAFNAAFRDGGIIHKVVHIPGYGSMQFEVRGTTSWFPNFSDVTAPDSSVYSVIGWPDGEHIDIGFANVAAPPGPAPDLRLRYQSRANIRSFAGTIGVPGDTPAFGQVIGTNQATSTEPGRIALAIVYGEHANVAMSYESSGLETTSTKNSAHVISSLGAIDLDGSNLIIVDPPPPNGHVQVRIIAVMYVPLWTSYVPDLGRALPVR